VPATLTRLVCIKVAISVPPAPITLSISEMAAWPPARMVRVSMPVALPSTVSTRESTLKLLSATMVTTSVPVLP